MTEILPWHFILQTGTTRRLTARAGLGGNRGGRRQEPRSAARRRRPWQPEVGQRGLKPHAALAQSSVTATQSQQATLTMGVVTHATMCQPSVRQYVNTSASTRPRAKRLPRPPPSGDSQSDEPLRSASTSAISLSTIGDWSDPGETGSCSFAFLRLQSVTLRETRTTLWRQRTPARSSAAATVI